MALVFMSGIGVETKALTLQGEAIEENVIYTDVSNLTFGSTYTGYSTSAVITITGIVSENINLSWRYNNPGFGLSKTSITPQEAAAGAKVTVYFQPTWTSPTYNTLLIMSAGAETVSIPVSGTKIKSDGYIFVSPANLTFETRVGRPVTKTFRLSYSKSNGNDAVMISAVDDESGSDNGSIVNVQNESITLGNSSKRGGGWDRFDWDKIKPIIIDPIQPILLKGLGLTITGDDGFTVTPSQVSLSDATGGYYVTVTYNPVNAGTHDATIKVSLMLGSAKPMYVNLHGTATSNDNSNRRGDVNASGKVDISDATDLIDILLNGSKPNACADVNGDTLVDISDITSLIDLLLK